MVKLKSLPDDDFVNETGSPLFTILFLIVIADSSKWPFAPSNSCNETAKQGQESTRKHRSMYVFVTPL